MSSLSLTDLVREREIRKCRGKSDSVDDQLEAFQHWAANHCWIQHPKGRRKLVLRDAQLKTARDYIEHDQNLILKARQIGFTTLSMTFALWMALFHDDWSCINLSRREDDAAAALAMAIFAYDHLPEWMRERLPDRTDRGSTKMSFANDSFIESHPSKNNPARGRTVSLIIVDEWAFFENAEDAWASIKPTFDIGGRVVALSTANGYGNLFHQMVVGAMTGSNSFNFIFFPWNAVPERDAAWYETQRKDMLEWQLHQEFPSTPEEAFIKSGNPVFDVDALIQIVTTDPKRGYLFPLSERHSEFREAVDGPLQVWEHQQRGVKYVMGVDVAEGLEHGDWSVVHVINLRTGQVVAKWRGHIAPDLLGHDVLWYLGWRYGCAFAGIEVNNHGLSTCVALRDRGYPNIYWRTSYDERSMKQTRKIGWRTQSNTKPLMIDELAKALREPEIQLLDAETIGELRTYVRDADGKMHGSPFDDQVISLAIANQMRKHSFDTQWADEESDYLTFNWAMRELLNEGKGDTFRVGAHNTR